MAKTRKQKVVRYKVWVHIEGLDSEDDCIEGDEYYEPLEAGVCETADEAEKLRYTLIDAAFDAGY